MEAARPTRLGRYAETLLAFFAAQAPCWRLVAANLPVRVSGRTLGECDFLLVSPQGERLHWELAVKCYLCAATAGAAALSDYVGPNLADRFDLKYRRLVDHQLPLTEREEFAFTGQAGPWAASMFVKGWLFYRARRAAVGAGRARCGAFAWLLGRPRRLAGAGRAPAGRHALGGAAAAGLARAASA